MGDSTNLPEVDINAIATDLNNKMDRDGSNVETLSQSFINNLFTSLLPDYDNGTSITLPFTASENGWLIGYCNAVGTTEGSLFVNGKGIGREAGDYIDVQIPLGVGDIVTQTNINNNVLKFYPLRQAT